MTWKRQTEGQPAWLTHLGPNFLVMVQPAAVGFRADLLFARSHGGIRVGFYPDEDAALAQAVDDARAILRAAAEAPASDDGLVTLPAEGLAETVARLTVGR